MKAMLAVIAMTAFSSLYARGVVGFDGEEWNGFDPVNKAVFLVGYVEGHTNATGSASRKISEELCTQYSSPKKDPETLLKCQTELKEKIQTLKIDRGNLLQISEGLDAHYSDYKNKKIPISVSIYVVSLAIDGEPENNLQKMLEELRQLFSKKQ